MSRKPSRGAKGVQSPTVPKKIEPGPRNRKAIDDAIERYAAAPVRVAVKLTPGLNGNISLTSPHADETGHVMHLQATLGTASSAFAAVAVGELEYATRDRGVQPGESEMKLNAGLAIVAAVGPESELEAALAVQMAGCHALSMEMLGRAKTAERTDHVELYGNMAVKLQRTFTAQIEALARLRGKGQQTVRVEHVTVHPGAQAIVGDVHHHAPGGPGAGAGSENQPHGTTTAAAITQASAALPGPDPLGNGVPISGNAERPMPAPRRVVARRSRQSERVEARPLESRDDRDAASAAGDAS